MGGKALPFLVTTFGNQFSAVRENAFILIVTYFQKAQELKGKTVLEGEDRRFGSICFHSFIKSFIQQMVGFVVEIQRLQLLLTSSSYCIEEVLIQVFK